MIDVFLLAVGLACLWTGTQLAIRSAVRISDRFGVSQVFVGLTLLAFGTDLPELVVAISGAVRNLGGVESCGLSITGVGVSRWWGPC